MRRAEPIVTRVMLANASIQNATTLPGWGRSAPASALFPSIRVVAQGLDTRFRGYDNGAFPRIQKPSSETTDVDRNKSKGRISR